MGFHHNGETDLGSRRRKRAVIRIFHDAQLREPGGVQVSDPEVLCRRRVGGRGKRDRASAGTDTLRPVSSVRSSP